MVRNVDKNHRKHNDDDDDDDAKRNNYVTKQFLLKALKDLEETLMATISDVRTQVDRNTQAIADAIALLILLKQQLDALLSGDAVIVSAAELQTIVDQLTTDVDALEAAIAANTPQEPV